MDAIKILGGLLGGRGQSGGLGRQVLQQILVQQQQKNQQQAQQAQRAQQQRAQQQRAQQQSRRGWDAGPQFDSVLRDVYGRRVGIPNTPQPRRHGHREHSQHHHGYDDNQLNERAVVLIRAMINAAKADGQIDQCEQDEIVKRLAPLSPQETQFLRDEFRRPLNVHDFAHSVPRGMEQEVYSVSLMAIDLDTHPEANYLRELAECLRIDPQHCNAIHHHYGAAHLYR